MNWSNIPMYGNYYVHKIKSTMLYKLVNLSNTDATIISVEYYHNI